MSRIGVIGCGYVGLVTGVCLSELGNDVVCVDVDKGKLESLSLGISPLYEPGLQQMLEKNLTDGRLDFMADIDNMIRRSQIIFIAVGTPTTSVGTSDLSQVNSAIERILSVVSREPVAEDKTVVMKSTVPVGTGERFCRLFKCTDRMKVRYVSNPEFLREGQAVQDFMMPDRVVVGGDDDGAVQTVASLYKAFEVPFVYTGTTNAELIKYASNAFLATKISFVNEIANLCEEVDADVGVVAEGMGLDPRINSHFLRAGIGYGGSCFPKDVKALKQLAGHNGYHFELLSAVIEVNEMQKTRPIQKLRKHLGSINGTHIGVLGLTFKPNTDDIRESVGVDVVKLLQFEGALVTAFDPLGAEQARRVLNGVTFVDDPYRVAEDAQAIVVATEDPLYASLDWSRIRDEMAYPLIIDGRNIIDRKSLPDGFILDQVGKPVELRRTDRVVAELSPVVSRELKKAS